MDSKSNLIRMVVLVVLSITCISLYGCDSGPKIESISPTNGRPGTKLVISGKGFGTKPGGKAGDYSYQSVCFDHGMEYHQTAFVYSWTDTEITVRVPYHPIGLCKVMVFPADGGSAESYFEFTEAPDVYLTYLNRQIGNGGTEVSVHGYDFGFDRGKVFFGPNEAEVIYWFDNLVRFKVPEDAQPNAYAVSLETAEGIESTMEFFIVPGSQEDFSAQKAAIQSETSAWSSDDWMLFFLEKSNINPNWEIIAVGDPGKDEKAGPTFLALMVWDNEEGAWHCLSRGPGPQWRDAEYRGEKIPSDLGEWDN